MLQTTSNITPKYRQEMHYNYVKNSVFGALTFTGKTCSPLLHYHCVNHANSCGNAIANSQGLLHAETGFSYFGTRYYDSDLMTGWLSVDPMADKYPSLSPYAYCAWNPIRLVDPDGEDIYWLDVTTGSLTLSQRTKDKTDKIIARSYQGIGRAKSFKTNASITFSKGVLDGKKIKITQRRVLFLRMEHKKMQ